MKTSRPPRTYSQKLLYLLRWQVFPLTLALPAHVAFVLRGTGKARTSAIRRARLAWHCLVIHLRIECGHNPAEALRVIEEIIELPSDMRGVVIECGAYLGGSTAKLSHAAAMTRRELIVCDSFEGLPEVAGSDHSLGKTAFHEGDYRAQLMQVKSKVARFGRIECVTFVPGWYDESLSTLRGIRIACAFWDVDLRESFISCIKALWPAVRPGTKVFLHDIDRASVVDVFTNVLWWRNEFGADPPRLFGAHAGLGRLSPLLGYVVKAS